MSKTRVLTGITTTGTPHLGNYLGAIKPAIASSRDPQLSSFFFLADYHALIKCHDPVRVARSTREIAVSWLAMGLDPEVATFYRQSDIPEITELSWILTCLTSKGLMNRAHAYKAAVDENQATGKGDRDDGVLMGLYSYPVLMAADILMFNASRIPVGKDQIQHIEMARDIGGRFNHTYKEIFALPEAVIDENSQTISGLDGRKMSKSYDNTIPLFCSSKELHKLINQIRTDLREPGEPKDPDTSTLFELYSHFASEQETEHFRNRFYEGIAWGDAKQELFEYLDAYLAEPRARYNEMMNDLGEVENILLKGAEKARQQSAAMLQRVREAVGIVPLNAKLSADSQTTGKKKQKSAEELARAEAGRRRAVLIQLQPLLDKVAAAADPAAAAQAELAERAQQLQGLKKKARHKAENELTVLQEEWAGYLR